MKQALLTGSLILALAAPAFAQVMPPPHRAPRVPVRREALLDRRPAPPQARNVKGLASIVDGQRLRIGDTDLRLFGVVPPDLSADYGPQARAELDRLAAGQPVACHIRDRSRDGSLLATCENAGGEDMALDLVKRGLAVTARGSISNTDLAGPYLSAELAAQNQRLGLWSIAEPAAAKMPAAAQPAPAVKDDKAQSEPAAPQTAPTPAQIQKAAVATAAAPAATAADDRGFFERYQTLLSTLLFLLAVATGIGGFFAWKKREREEECRTLAAALRGELMAARSICAGRIKTIADEESDRAATWPRLRATLYQASVGRIGLFGAELARQISSIYGQAADYAAYYSPNGGAAGMPKRAALESLAAHIEEVLPKLAAIEQSGRMPRFMPHGAPRLTYSSIAAAPQARPHITPAPARAATLPAPAQRAPAQTQQHAAAAEEPQPEPEMRNVTPPPPSEPAPATPVQSAMSAWEAVRAFIQNHRPAAAQPQEQPAPQDEYMSDYAAMIEADMARYAAYRESDENTALSPHKKSG